MCKSGSALFHLSRVVLALCCAGVAAGGAAAEPARAEKHSAAVQKAIDLERRWAGVTGLAVAVVEDGALVHRQALGLANVELRAPLTTATLFQLSSTTKAFTGVAAVLLARDGLLNLDAPACQYLQGLPSEWDTVTVRQLLTHTSGLPEVLDCEAESRSDALACVTQLPIHDPPGARFRYNQTNYFLVLRIIEEVTGESFEDVMRARVFEPCGMLSTAYAGSVFDLVPGRATSYYPDGQGGLRLRDYQFPQFLYSAAGLHSSLDDIVRFTQALDSGRLLGADGPALLWDEPTLNDGEVSTYGLGWDVKIHGGGRRSAGHEGGGLTTIRRFLDERLTVIVLANGSAARFDPDRLAARVAAAYDPRLAAPTDELADTMRARLLEGDVEGAKKAYAELADDPRLSHVSTEEMINDLGYELLARERPEEATGILRLNVARYPESANAHDSLGEALAANGERKAAIASYRRSLQLDPSNDNATTMLERLQSPGP